MLAPKLTFMDLTRFAVSLGLQVHAIICINSSYLVTHLFLVQMGKLSQSCLLLT